MTLELNRLDAEALRDARDHLRRAGAALRATSITQPDTASRLGALHAFVADAVDELAAIERSAVMRREAW